MAVLTPRRAPQLQPSTDRRQAVVVTALLVVFMLINFGDKAVLGLAAEPMMAELGMSASEYGLVSSAFYALFSVSAVVMGFVANRFSNKKILLVLALLWAVSQLPIIFFAGVATVFVSRVVLGAAEGPANPLAVNAAQRWFPEDKRNLPTSLVNLGAALGVVTLAPLLGHLIDQHGWRSAFVVLLALGLAWSLLWWLFGRDGSADTAPAPSTDGVASAVSGAAARTGAALLAHVEKVRYRHIFLSGTGVSVFFAGFAAYWSMALLVAWVPLYLGSALDLGTTTAGRVVVLPWLLSAILVPLFGLVTDRLLQRGVSSRVARVGVAAGCVAVSGIAMATLTGVDALGPKLALLAVAFSVSGVQVGVGMTVMAEITPVRQRAAVLSTFTAVIGLSGIVAPALTGRLVQAAGMTDLSGYHHAFGLTALLLVAGAVGMALFARPERDAARIAVREGRGARRH